jgi:hypothetical protein
MLTCSTVYCTCICYRLPKVFIQLVDVLSKDAPGFNSGA